ncbi:WYL domain-containing protein [Aeromicrobium sp. IC_218]|uniref:helix-turn-helix transcriptional regulator n=1 Tax=Aeromicrobium sp. IC_218 TaxID=2545468 RepID=UPI00103FF2A4|nr:WYL domain-containing protein [Aeromicrobium sp. IC_218]TCI97723.1 WYL domain-containing protein [Aeromicrobium sp. IC_218]
MSTSARLLALLSLLQARRDWPGPLLAQRLDVSPRTVRRDVERLREMGYRVRSTRGLDGGYRLEAGSQLPPLLLDDEQAVALAVALGAAATTGAEVRDAAERALATLRHVLPEPLRRRADALEAATTAVGPADPVPAELLDRVAAAVRDRVSLRMDHRAPGAEPVAGPARRVEPHHLVARGGRWYLVGWDLDRDDWRTFRLDRVRLRTPDGPRFVPREVPGGDVAAFVSARFKGSDGPDAWPCRGEVVVHLPVARVAPFVGDGLVEPLGSDRCRVLAGSWSWTALAASLGRFDAEVEVVGPDELRSACAALADRLSRAARV